MPKLVKVYSEDELRRQVHFILSEHQVPGLLRFLASLPYGAEGAWWRGVASLWLKQHAEAPNLHAKVEEALLAGDGVGHCATVPTKRRSTRKTLPRSTASAPPVRQAPPEMGHSVRVQAIPVAPAAVQAPPSDLSPLPKPAVIESAGVSEAELAFLNEFDNLSN